MHAQSREVLKIISSLEAHSSDRLYQRSGVRELRVRGDAASWASLAAVAVCGGVQECNLAARVGCEAWTDSHLLAHWPRIHESPEHDEL